MKGYTFFGKAYGLTDKYFSVETYKDGVNALDAAVKHKASVINLINTQVSSDYLIE